MYRVVSEREFSYYTWNRIKYQIIDIPVKMVNRVYMIFFCVKYSYLLWNSL